VGSPDRRESGVNDDFGNRKRSRGGGRPRDATACIAENRCSWSNGEFVENALPSSASPGYQTHQWDWDDHAIQSTRIFATIRSLRILVTIQILANLVR